MNNTAILTSGDFQVIVWGLGFSSPVPLFFDAMKTGGSGNYTGLNDSEMKSALDT